MEIASLKIADAETEGLLEAEDLMLAHSIFHEEFNSPEKADSIDAKCESDVAFEAEQVQEQEQEQVQEQEQEQEMEIASPITLTVSAYC